MNHDMSHIIPCSSRMGLVYIMAVSLEAICMFVKQTRGDI